MLAVLVPAVLALALSFRPAVALAQDPETMSATSAGDLVTRIDFADDRAFILASGALYRLHPESESWTVTTASEGLPESPLASMSFTDDEVWIAGAGASVSDARFDDWQRYDPARGLPGRRVVAIAVDDDYAYAATDEGAARFDRYVREWEPLRGLGGRPLGPARDVAVGDDRVWFALANGVAQYRKGAETMAVDSLLGGLGGEASRGETDVLALRLSSRHLWAITRSGLARYDTALETWTAYRAGVDLPDTRIRAAALFGEDLALATDRGLWWFRADNNIWRLDDSAPEMPGTQVRAFIQESERLWVATERAFAVYERAESRWLDFTTRVPVSPASVQQMRWAGGALLILTEDRIVYALPQGEDNPSLYNYRSRPLEESGSEYAPLEGWRLGETDAGYGLLAADGRSVLIKGGTTVYVESADGDEQSGGGLMDFTTDQRVDLTLSGRLGNDRTLIGFYDTTDPENTAYQLSYRGARDDVLRNVSGGEIDQAIWNSQLAPEVGLRGGWARGEFGPRSEATRRRVATLDGWAGERRTYPGRDVFRGGSRAVEGSLRDIDYVRGAVFAPPPAWENGFPEDGRIYRDDGNPATDDANTLHTTLAGLAGAWDLLEPLVDYSPGAGNRTLILSAQLQSSEDLVATSDDFGSQFDLAQRVLLNHYLLARDPVPGTLEIAIADSSGAETEPGGESYLSVFGLDRDRDGQLDPDRFSSQTGLLAFPDSLPFPDDVYASSPRNLYTIRYSFRSRFAVFQLAHRRLVPGSERISVDRELLQSEVDYSLIPATGLFVLFENVVLDDDTIVEVSYQYEAEDSQTGDSQPDDSHPASYAAQLGLAPADPLFIGISGLEWEDDAGQSTGSLNLNSRLEWKSADALIRLMPELMLSDGAEQPAGRATAFGLQSRWRRFECNASYRNLGANFATTEDRRTLWGRLREEASANARLEVGRNWQGAVEWRRRLSDDADTNAQRGPWHTEDALIGSVRFLRAGFPNLALRQGFVTIDADSGKLEKRYTRGELELDVGARRASRLGLQRLYIRSYFQRTNRSDGGAHGDRETDHAYAQVNGSTGNAFGWNAVFEDSRTRTTVAATDVNLEQRLDATIQARPHPSLDGFMRWESSRDLYRDLGGAAQGFACERLTLVNLRLYPGRLTARFAAFSFHVDVSRSDSEQGEPGTLQPGGASLFARTGDVDRTDLSRSTIIEGRWQILSWLRLVERGERSASAIEIADTRRVDVRSTLESRLEMRPRSGLLTLRWKANRGEEGVSGRSDGDALHGDWDQAWGRGYLTYASVQLSRSDRHDGRVGERTETLHPQARLTLRRDRMRIDAGLSLGFTWTWVTDISALPESAADQDSRGISLSATCSLQPHRLVNLKAQYSLSRDLPAGASGDQDREWMTGQEVKLRISVRV